MRITDATEYVQEKYINHKKRVYYGTSKPGERRTDGSVKSGSGRKTTEDTGRQGGKNIPGRGLEEGDCEDRNEGVPGWGK